MDLVRQSFGITLVFVLLWLSLWFLKRRGLATLGLRLPRPDSKREIQLVERLSLTPQHSVQLVRVRSRVLLLGLHPAGISVLTEDTGNDTVFRQESPQ